MGAQVIQENFAPAFDGNKISPEVVEKTRLEVIEQLKMQLKPEFLNRIDVRKFFCLGVLVFQGFLIFPGSAGYVRSPVSYTHLDVYKRQQLRSRNPPSPRVFLSISTHFTATPRIPVPPPLL